MHYIFDLLLEFCVANSIDKRINAGVEDDIDVCHLIHITSVIQDHTKHVQENHYLRVQPCNEVNTKQNKTSLEYIPLSLLHSDISDGTSAAFSWIGIGIFIGFEN